MLGAIAALTAFEDREHIEWEREENNRVKAFTVGALNDLGYDVPESHTNHLFVDLRAPARGFREACMERKVAVGRDSHPGKTRTAVFLWAAWKRWKLRSGSSVRCLASVAGISGTATVGRGRLQSRMRVL